MIKVLYIYPERKLPRDRKFIHELSKNENLDLITMSQKILLDQLLIKKVKLEVDFIINFSHSIHLSKLLEKEGLRVINSAQAATIAIDKWSTYQILKSIGIPQPKTSLIQEFKPPYIFKDRKGSFGINVFLINDDRICDNSNDKYIFQEYIEESAGKSIRVVLIDKKPVAWLLKVNEQSFLSHYRYGGQSYNFEMTEEVRNMCCAAAERLNLDYCAIDLLLSDRGPLLLEVNSGAGITGIEEFTGVNVPKLFGDYLVELYNKTKKEA